MYSIKNIIGIICISGTVYSMDLSLALQSLQTKLSILETQLDTLKTRAPLAKIQKMAENIYKFGNITIEILRQDITTMNVDAIVNAANKSLGKNPGGVAGAIWQAAGANQINDWITKNIGTQGTELIPTGQVKWTPSFDLGKNYGVKGIIQAVGPNCSAGEDINLLYDTYKNSIQVANQKGYQSIAFPGISTDIFGCDHQVCANLAVKAILDNAPGTSLTTIYLVYINPKSKYPKLLAQELDKGLD